MTGRRVVAALVALVAGFFLAAAGSRLAWEAVPDFPAGAELAEITGAVYPGLPVEGRRTADGLFFDPMGDGGPPAGYGEDFQFATYDFGPRDAFLTGDYRTWADETARRLTGAGWTVREVRPLGATVIATGELDESGRLVVADRDGLSLEVEADTAISDTPAGSFFSATTVLRLAPWYVRVAALAGWPAGAALGWLLVRWAGPAGRLTTGFTVAALALLLPGTLAGVAGLVLSVRPGSAELQPFWALSLTWGYGCTALGLVLGLVALAGAVQARLRMPSSANVSTRSR